MQMTINRSYTLAIEVTSPFSHYKNVEIGKSILQVPDTGMSQYW